MYVHQAVVAPLSNSRSKVMKTPNFAPQQLVDPLARPPLLHCRLVVLAPRFLVAVQVALLAALAPELAQVQSGPVARLERMWELMASAGIG